MGAYEINETTSITGRVPINNIHISEEREGTVVILIQAGWINYENLQVIEIRSILSLVFL